MTLHELYKKLPYKCFSISVAHNDLEFSYYNPGVGSLEIKSDFDDYVHITYKKGKHKEINSIPCSRDRKEELICELAYHYISEEEEK